MFKTDGDLKAPAGVPELGNVLGLLSSGYERLAPSEEPAEEIEPLREERLLKLHV